MKEYRVSLTKKEVTDILRRLTFGALFEQPYFFKDKKALAKYNKYAKERDALIEKLKKSLLS